MTKSQIFQEKAKLIKNIEVAKNYYKIVLACSRIAQQAKPGQFVTVRVGKAVEPLLRRPFGVHRVNGTSLEILFETRGEGTKILSQRKSGDLLDVIGPLGNGFDFGNTHDAPGNTILVAGGMGVAPLVFLAEKLTAQKTQYTKGATQVFIGAKTRKQLLCVENFKRLGCAVRTATDDGSRGLKGNVTKLLKQFLHRACDSPLDCAWQKQHTTIFSCGPRPMLKEISRLAQEYNITAQVSLEEHMACGIGACLGCVVKTRDSFLDCAGNKRRTNRDSLHYDRVCKEGPVFLAQDVIWD